MIILNEINQKNERQLSNITYVWNITKRKIYQQSTAKTNLRLSARYTDIPEGTVIKNEGVEEGKGQDICMKVFMKDK